MQHYKIIIMLEYLYSAACLVLYRKGEIKELERIEKNTAKDSWSLATSDANVE